MINDGTHVPCVVTLVNKQDLLEEKVFQHKIMDIYDWNMCFSFVLAGFMMLVSLTMLLQLLT